MSFVDICCMYWNNMTHLLLYHIRHIIFLIIFWISTVLSLNSIFRWCKGLFRYGYIKFICRYIISEFLIFQHVIGCLGLFEFEFDSTWKDYLNMDKIFEYYFWICNILYIRKLFKYEWKNNFFFLDIFKFHILYHLLMKLYEFLLLISSVILY